MYYKHKYTLCSKDNIKKYLINNFVVSAVLEIEPRALSILGRCCAPETWN